MAERFSIKPRQNWQEKVEKIGFDWHTVDHVPYWDESAYWHFTDAEVDAMEHATNEGYQMILEAIEHVITGKQLPLFGYDEATIKLIEKSWEESDDLPHLYGRFDFALDDGQVKILEFNGDTPTSLFEASVVQWYWLEELFPQHDQFNTIHEKLLTHLQAIDFRRRAQVHGNEWDRQMHVTCVTPHIEDQGTVSYIEMVAKEAGVPVKFVPLTDIGLKEERFDGVREDSYFVDADGKRISTIFKLVPWEWLLEDPFGEKLAQEVLANRLTVIEPAWKMVAANKRLLATLWELYPYHPNLLPTYTTADKFAGSSYVRKPVWGREGQNVTIFNAEGQIEHAEDGNYTDNMFVFQERTALLKADDNYAVIGSWVVNGESAGIGVRESKHAITNNVGRFVPHVFGDASTDVVTPLLGNNDQ